MHRPSKDNSCNLSEANFQHRLTTLTWCASQILPSLFPVVSYNWTSPSPHIWCTAELFQFLVVTQVMRRPCWCTKQWQNVAQVLHNNRIKVPKDFFCHCSIHQRGHHDVTWKPRIPAYLNSLKCQKIYPYRLGNCSLAWLLYLVYQRKPNLCIIVIPRRK